MSSRNCSSPKDASTWAKEYEQRRQHLFRAKNERVDCNDVVNSSIYRSLVGNKDTLRGSGLHDQVQQQQDEQGQLQDQQQVRHQALQEEQGQSQVHQHPQQDQPKTVLEGEEGQARPVQQAEEEQVRQEHQPRVRSEEQQQQVQDQPQVQQQREDLDEHRARLQQDDQIESDQGQNEETSNPLLSSMKPPSPTSLLGLEQKHPELFLPKMTSEPVLTFSNSRNRKQSFQQMFEEVKKDKGLEPNQWRKEYSERKRQRLLDSSSFPNNNAQELLAEVKKNFDISSSKDEVESSTNNSRPIKGAFSKSSRGATSSSLSINVSTGAAIHWGPNRGASEGSFNNNRAWGHRRGRGAFPDWVSRGNFRP